LDPKTVVEIGVSLKPYEQVLDGLGPIESGSRLDGRIYIKFSIAKPIETTMKKTITAMPMTMPAIAIPRPP